MSWNCNKNSSNFSPLRNRSRRQEQQQLARDSLEISAPPKIHDSSFYRHFFSICSRYPWTSSSNENVIYFSTFTPPHSCFFARKIIIFYFYSIPEQQLSQACLKYSLFCEFFYFVCSARVRMEFQLTGYLTKDVLYSFQSMLALLNLSLNSSS